jgi:hypothetical protein
MMMARDKEAEVRRRIGRSSVTGGDEGTRRSRSGVASGPSPSRLLVSKTRELIRLADSLDCKRDELVRMIQSLS